MRKFKTTDVKDQDLKNLLKHNRILGAFIHDLNNTMKWEYKEDEGWFKTTLRSLERPPARFFVQTVDFYLMENKIDKETYWTLNNIFFKLKTGRSYD